MAASTESILTSVKKLLGLEEECTEFDSDIIIHINSAFMILNQIGVGPSDSFNIMDSSDMWTDFSTDINQLEIVKSYVYLKVRKLFDPPTSGSVMDSMDKMISEFEWRLSVQVDPGKEATNG